VALFYTAALAWFCSAVDIWKIRQNDSDLLVLQSAGGVAYADDAWCEGNRTLASLEAQYPARPAMQRAA
jgi:hypothetical protein